MMYSLFAMAGAKIEVIAPFEPGGTTGVMMEIIAKHNPDKLELDIKYIPNCALVRQMAENDNVPRMYVADQDWWILPQACTPEINVDDVVSVSIVGDVMMCARTDEADYKKYFAQKAAEGKPIRTAIHSDHDKTIEVLNSLGAKLGVTFDAIRYGSSSKARNAFRSNEVEYVFSSRDLSRDKNTQCFFTTRKEPFKTMIPLVTVIPEEPWNTLSASGFFYTRAMTPELRKVVEEVVMDAQAGDEYKAVMAKRGGTQYTVPTLEAQNRLRKLKEMLE